MLTRRETIKAGLCAIIGTNLRSILQPEPQVTEAETNACIVQLGNQHGHPHILHTNGYEPRKIQLVRVNDAFYYFDQVQWLAQGGYIDMHCVVYTVTLAPGWHKKMVIMTSQPLLEICQQM